MVNLKNLKKRDNKNTKIEACVEVYGNLGTVTSREINRLRFRRAFCLQTRTAFGIAGKVA
jgi:hypothetical protein